MAASVATRARKTRVVGDVPYHVEHPSFTERTAEGLYGLGSELPMDRSVGHMHDDVTRDRARRMHYAAWRMDRARDPLSRRRWEETYYRYRDQIVLGNRKLVFRAVRRWSPTPTLADDMTGDCQIVLIQAVAAYNPWLGIRFSTYAFTCLMRALSRLSQKYAADRLARSMPLDALPDGEPRDRGDLELGIPGMAHIDEFLRDGNDLLSHREKRVLIRRFSLGDQGRPETLEEVGRELGLSKERVRQVQASALGKLRQALHTPAHS